MIIKKYGITLVRLKENDIELVRRKRNSADISSLMQFREKITRKMQAEWFKSIHNIHNNYFIAHYDGEKIGLVNGKNSDYGKRQSEGGMFIWEKKYWGTIIPALCSVMMTDFTFLVNDFKRNYIKILRANKNAINYNRLLGYVPTKDFPSDQEAQWYVLRKKDYLENIWKIRKGIRVVTGDDTPLSVENIDLSDETEADLIRLYKPLPAYIKKNVIRILERDGFRTVPSKNFSANFMNKETKNLRLY